MDKSAKPEVLISKLVSGGEGLAFYDGKALFVEGGLAGETVRVEVTEDKKKFRRGRVVEVLVPSPDRRLPACAVYGQCGGCDLQHLAFSAQGQAKQAIVQENFSRLGRLQIDLPEIVQKNGWSYRNRIQLHKDAAGRVGFRRRSSDEVLPIACCPVAVPGLQDLFSGQALADFPPGRYTAFALDDRAWLENRDGEVTIDFLGKPLTFSLKGFFQSNLEVLAELVPWALDGLAGQTALDLYCGAGLFGAFLADRFETVLAVEENPHALALARRNIVGPLHRFFAETLEKWADRRDLPARLDAVVVDPPREGLSPRVLEYLLARRPGRLVYVSCNPDTLARDVGRLVEAGWKLQALRLFDFYPQTSHIEACAKLEPPR